MRRAMGRLLAILVASALLGSVVPGVKAAVVKGRRTAVFLTPHQDDETTSMGVSIKKAARAGVHVVVVLLTDGSESGQCYLRYGNGESVRRQRDEGGLSAPARAMCTAQRDAEFKAAVTQLGADYLIRSDRKQDDCTSPDIAKVVASCGPSDSLTKAYVRSVIDALVATYGAGTSFNSMSYLEDRHCDACGNGTTGAGSPDHAVIGRALLDAYHAGDVSHVRFYIKPSLWNDWPGPGDARPIGHWAHAKINDALRMYGAHAPDGDGAGPTVAGDGIWGGLHARPVRAVRPSAGHRRHVGEEVAQSRLHRLRLLRSRGGRGLRRSGPEPPRHRRWRSRLLHPPS